MVTRVQPSPFKKFHTAVRSSESLMEEHQKLVPGFSAVAAGVLGCLNAAPLPVSIVSVASIAEMMASNSFKTAQSVKHDTSFLSNVVEVPIRKVPAWAVRGRLSVLPL